MSEWLLPWLSAFALTQAVEMPIYVRALRERPTVDRLPRGARGATRHAASLGPFAEGGVAESSQYPDTASFRLLALDENPGARRRAGLHHGLQALALAFGASALTHPVVWFVMPELIPDDWLTMVIVAELFAITAEAAWFRAFGLPRALAWAGFANAASVLVGLGLRELIGWP